MEYNLEQEINEMFAKEDQMETGIVGMEREFSQRIDSIRHLTEEKSQVRRGLLETIDKLKKQLRETEKAISQSRRNESAVEQELSQRRAEFNAKIEDGRYKLLNVAQLDVNAELHCKKVIQDLEEKIKNCREEESALKPANKGFLPEAVKFEKRQQLLAGLLEKIAGAFLSRNKGAEASGRE